ncbi:MAG: ribonuclease domain-containing protein [Lautropia sp.]
MSPRPSLRMAHSALWRIAGRVAAAAALLLASAAAPLAPGAGELAAREARELRAAVIAVDELPRQARQTLQLIRQGGPFPYAKDGSVFGNRERLLPRKPRGYYTEYTVPTPFSRDRGARRIVAGGERGRHSEFYYTDDHYASFRRIIDPLP